MPPDHTADHTADHTVRHGLLLFTALPANRYLLEDITGSRAAAVMIIADVVRTTYDFEHDPAAMLTARAALAAAIEAAMTA